MRFQCDNRSLNINVWALSYNPSAFYKWGMLILSLARIPEGLSRHNARTTGSSSIIHSQKDKHMLPFPPLLSFCLCSEGLTHLILAYIVLKTHFANAVNVTSLSSTTLSPSIYKPSLAVFSSSNCCTFSPLFLIWPPVENKNVHWKDESHGPYSSATETAKSPR